MNMSFPKGLDLDTLGRCSASLDDHSIQRPGLPVGSGQARRLRVCVVSHDLVGPIRNGGVGTACTTIAETLAEAGHQVTALYANAGHCETESIPHWQHVYRDKGIDFVPLPRVPVSFNGSFAVSRAYECFAWLRWREFDVVHAPELIGVLYFCLAAKRQGLAFRDTQFVVGTHSPTLWAIQGNRDLPQRFEELERDFLERECVARADVLWSPSQYLLDWERARGWRHPDKTYVQPNLVPTDIKDESNANRTQRAVTELVFFGRLEPRKGLVLFCDAIDRLHRANPELLERTRVTFLGKRTIVGTEPSPDYIARRSREWPSTVIVETQFDRNQALAYLRGEGRLAVMPSLMDNSPLAVVECVAAGVPFLASNAGGIPEIVAKEDHAATLFPLRADRLAQALRRVIEHGAIPARFAFDPAANKQTWLNWHAQLEPSQAQRENGSNPSTPLVSVCMAHHNRPKYLEQAIESLRAQDYPNFEVILVDDASSDPESVRTLDALEADFARRGWKIIRRAENQFACAARNLAATHARGRFLMFMDDDNVAKSHEISTLVSAALHSHADITTCFLDAFRGEAAPRANDAPVNRHPFLGPAVTLSLWQNTLGDTNMLIRAEVFEALGGFTEEYGVGHEDRELLTRAVLQGFRLEVVPEALFWYRHSSESLTQTTTVNSNHLRAIRPLLDCVPEPIRPALLLAQGLLYRADDAEEQLHHTRVALSHRAHAATPVPHAHEIALRYRLVDRLNNAAKRLPIVHPVAKSLALGGRAVWRVCRGRGP